jgi:predicted small lipoprotein YifL
LARLAVVGALAAALGLAACGRKGPLDPPPLAAGEPAPAAQPPRAGGATIGPDGQPIAARGPQRRIILDALLD